MKSFKVNDYNYNISSIYEEGTFCRVYYGERIIKKNKENICLKIINNKHNNDLMINEACILNNIQHKSLPVYLDSFKIEDGRRVNVIKNIKDSYTLRTLKGHYLDGLPQEHLVWIMDRLLSVLGFLHSNNIIHGSIEPDNIIITPRNHNGLLIDYLLAVPKANQEGAKYVGINDYSAPEIKLETTPSPASDMYSLGKSMEYILAKQKADKELIQFIHEFLHDDQEQRKSDAWESWHELKDLRIKLFGVSNQFLKLK